MRILYILNDNFEEVHPIDDYVSLIWTERFNKPGDWQLVTAPNRDQARLLTEGTVVSINDSYRMMVVETIVEKSVDDGFLLEYSGRSLEAVLFDRVGRVPVHSGASNTWLNSLVSDALMEAKHSPSDKLANLAYGTNKIYPYSTIQPNLITPPYSNSGWTEIGKAHDDANGIAPIGYRILRVPFTTQLYYENYTGNDRSQDGKFRIPLEGLVYPNPLFYETVKDIEVWRNIAHNPGFSNGKRPISGTTYYFSHGIEVSEIECEWSKSGKGLKIPSPSDRIADNRTATFLSFVEAVGNKYDGVSSWAGKQFTLSASVEIKTPQAGTINPRARRIGIYTKSSSSISLIDTPFAVSNAAPNTIGVHKVSVTFVVPSTGYWAAIAWNGDGITNEGGVVWGDLSLVQGPSNPMGYFDSNYSPDPDLTPSMSDDGRNMPVLTGRMALEDDEANMINCALVQSRQWEGAENGISLRMIQNKEGWPSGRFRLKDTAYSAGVEVYQDKWFSNTASDFGSVQLYKDSTLVRAGGAKPNVANRRRSYNVSGYEDVNYFDEVILRGGFDDFGSSLWWDQLYITKNQYLFGYKTLDMYLNQAVIFAEDLDSFEVSESRMSIGEYKNVAYVTRKDALMMLDDGNSGDGLLRRNIHVSADSLQGGPNLHWEMESLGMKALADNRRSSLIDGEVPPSSRYIYDEDYSLGDIVMVRNRMGAKMFARVVEQIFVADENGTYSYPTLEEEGLSAFGTWRDPQYNVTWFNADSLGTWSQQP